jgi:4-amino-4-deoxy-L-arabinose transferase-like glycosyltransferase
LAERIEPGSTADMLRCSSHGLPDGSLALPHALRGPYHASMGIEHEESGLATSGGISWLPESHAERAVLASLLIVGVALRVYGLADHGLWIDEYGTWWAVAGQSWSDCWTRVLEIHGQSPFYYLIVRLSVDLLGVGPASLRLPSLMFGIGLLALAYPLGMRIFRDRKMALLAVAAFALNERLIYYSQEARPYALALLLAVCSFHFYATLLERDTRGTRVGFVLTTALTYYAHYFFGIIVLVQAVHFLSTRPERWRSWFSTAVALGLSLTPGLWQLSAIFARRDSLAWISEPTSWLSLLEPAGALLDPAILGLTAIAALWAWMGERPPLRRSLGAHGGLGILWFVIPVLVFSIAPGLAGINLAHARYLIVAAPAVPLIYAVLLAIPYGHRHQLPGDPQPSAKAALRSLPLLVFLGSTIVLRIIPFVSEEGSFWWFYQHGWQDAVQEITTGFEPGDLILYRTHFVELDQLVRGESSQSTTEFVGWPLLAHLPPGREFPRRALPYSDSPENRELLWSIVQDAASARRVWLVGLEIDDPTGSRSVLTRAIRFATQAQGMRIVSGHVYGFVRVVLLEGLPKTRENGPG